jgi:hypothetical protein
MMANAGADRDEPVLYCRRWVQIAPTWLIPAVFYYCHHRIGILCPLITDVDCANISRMPHHDCAASSAKVRVEADINESNTGLFKEVSASKVALYPFLMLPILPIKPQPAARHSVQPRPASPVDTSRL